MCTKDDDLTLQVGSDTRKINNWSDANLLELGCVTDSGELVCVCQGLATILITDTIP